MHLGILLLVSNTVILDDATYALLQCDILVFWEQDPNNVDHALRELLFVTITLISVMQKLKIHEDLPTSRHTEMILLLLVKRPHLFTKLGLNKDSDAHKICI